MSHLSYLTTIMKLRCGGVAPDDISLSRNLKMMHTVHISHFTFHIVHTVYIVHSVISSVQFIEKSEFVFN